MQSVKISANEFGGGLSELFESVEISIFNAECLPNSLKVAGRIDVDGDLAELGPYLAATLPRRYYNHEAAEMTWHHQGRLHLFKRRQILISGLEDLADAEIATRELFGRFAEIWSHRDRITPDHDRRATVGVLDLFRLLPATNCRECGEPTCMAFAAKIARADAKPLDCPPLASPDQSSALQQIESMLGFSNENICFEV